MYIMGYSKREYFLLKFRQYFQIVSHCGLTKTDLLLIAPPIRCISTLSGQFIEL